MIIKFIEATDATEFNWGKFAVCRFEPEERAYRSVIDGAALVPGQGWTPNHVLVLDLATGEGAVFRPGGSAKADLNQAHEIWVCPMFEPFLEWLYKQDLGDLENLPGLVNLGEVATALRGYRRQRLAPPASGSSGGAG